MILGVGVDVFATSRLAKLLDEDPNCARQLFTPEELASIGAPNADVHLLATLFAIKEAAFKALAPPPSAGAHWREVAVQLCENSPVVRLAGNLAAVAELQGRPELHVATSGWGDLVVALVIAEKPEGH